MSETYDWIVVGNGVTGASVSYELAKNGQTVLLIERHHPLQGATRYSYGGVAYWSATTPLTFQLCQDSHALYPKLGEELGHDIGFSEIDLLLTVSPDQDPETASQKYLNCLNPPQPLSTQEACELEPLLNPDAISGALTVKHGQVDPEAMVAAYNQAFQSIGGKIQIATVTGLERAGDRITGVTTDQGGYSADKVLLSTGGLTRSLLEKEGIAIRQYFTHAELIETPILDDVRLRTLIMPADTQRFDLEAEAGNPELDSHWDEMGREIVPPILDVGVVQLPDGRLRIGQVSRALTDPHATIDAAQSEMEMRQGIEHIVPALRNVPGQWHHCLVAFSGDRLPLIGPFSQSEGLWIFSGFSNPFAILPPLARRFAAHVTGGEDDIIPTLAPDRPGLTAWQ